SPPTHQRHDITKEILASIVSGFHDTYNDINLKAAFCTAFAAFLRLGEFTWDEWNDHSHLTCLSRGSIQFTVDGNVLMNLPSSKTDQFRKGTVIPLSASHDTTCPVSALRLLFRRYPKPNTAPLFARAIGSFNRSWVLARLQPLLRTAGIDPQG